MVSFSCENCGDVLTKKKLDGHRNQCRGASFTCLDCMVHFYGTDYRAHTSCISEAQKYQGHLYREKDNNKKGGKGSKRNSHMPGSFPDNSQAMVPRNAYVEDVAEGAEDSNAIAVVDVPPRAPTPPPAHEALPENVNVFDFLVSEETPNAKRREVEAPNARMIEETRHYTNGDSQYSQYSNGDGSQYLHHGFSYGNAPVEPTFQRYDSWQNMTESQPSQPSQHTLMPPPPPHYITQTITPGPKSERKEKHKSEKSDKKRKRQHVEDLDLSSASKRPSSRGNDMIVDAPSTGGRVLHSGLTGGLHKLVTDPDFYEDRIDAGPTPISPIKRTRREDKDERKVKDDRRKSSYTSYSTVTSKPSKHSEDKHSHRSRSKDRESQASSKHRHSKRRDSSSSPEDRRRSTSRKEYRTIEYPARSGSERAASVQPSSIRPSSNARPASVQPSDRNQMVSYSSRAELFLSFINKGPESERGCSINKALKRYHRERDVRGEEKEEEDKELWKSLRMRRNSRGEIVLFV